MDGQLVFQLLAGYVELVDAITPRGAFKGDELLNVGMMRQKTIEILKEAQEAAEAAEAAEGADTKPTPAKPNPSK